MSAMQVVRQPDEPQRKLAQKLIDVALDIGAIEKDGYNRAQNYHFTSADNVVGEIRRKLFEKRVLLLGSEESTEQRLRPTKQGGETAITTVHVEFIFVDGETGERIELRWPGQGEDPMDKGIGKACTNALKLFLRQQFLIPWGNDDPEADEGSDARAGMGAGAQMGDTVDLLAKARGLSNVQLNEALVAGGLPAQQGNPFATFMRIPAANAAAVEAHLDQIAR
jgi:hypothetical protein